MNTTIITSRDNENDYYQEVIAKSYMLTEGRQKPIRQRLTHIAKIENHEAYKDNLGNIYETFDDIPEGLHSLIIQDGNLPDENEKINMKLQKFKEGVESVSKIEWDWLANQYLDNVGNSYDTIDNIPYNLRHLVEPIPEIKKQKYRVRIKERSISCPFL